MSGQNFTQIVLTIIKEGGGEEETFPIAIPKSCKIVPGLDWDTPGEGWDSFAH